MSALEIVEREQTAWEAQNGDWNNEVFPAIKDLREKDTFNLITFSGATRILWDKPRDNTQANRDEALKLEIISRPPRRWQPPWALGFNDRPGQPGLSISKKEVSRPSEAVSGELQDLIQRVVSSFVKHISIFD